MKDQKEVIKKVIDYIEQNIEKEISLDNISKSIGYSKFHLSFGYGCSRFTCLSYKKWQRLFYHYGYEGTGKTAGKSTEI